MYTPIAIQSVDAIRITCRNCGVAVIMPIQTVHEIPHKCFNCYHEFPASSIQDFMRQFRHMKDVVGKQEVTFMAHLEADIHNLK